jgi:hypothetical protein
METEPFWKRELKQILAISGVFFVIFVLFLLMKKALLDDYAINYYILGKSLVGSLIIAKVVLVFDLLPLTKRTDNLPNIYRVFFRSFVYLLGFVIFTFIEDLIKGIIDKKDFSISVADAFHHLSEPAFVTSMVGVFVAFLFFNAFWVIRSKYGAPALYELFFKKHD